MTHATAARRGRKAQAAGTQRQQLTVWLHPHLRQWLLQQPQGAGPLVEELVQEAYEREQKPIDIPNTQYGFSAYWTSDDSDPQSGKI